MPERGSALLHRDFRTGGGAGLVRIVGLRAAAGARTGIGSQLPTVQSGAEPDRAHYRCAGRMS